MVLQKWLRMLGKYVIFNACFSSISPYPCLRNFRKLATWRSLSLSHHHDLYVCNSLVILVTGALETYSNDSSRLHKRGNERGASHQSSESNCACNFFVFRRLEIFWAADTCRCFKHTLKTKNLFEKCTQLLLERKTIRRLSCLQFNQQWRKHGGWKWW
jgi:hypothetical protein